MNPQEKMPQSYDRYLSALFAPEDSSLQTARQEMERLFGMRIYLDLHVRIEPGWRSRSAFLNALDWRTMAGEDDT